MRLWNGGHLTTCEQMTNLRFEGSLQAYYRTVDRTVDGAFGRAFS